MVPILLIVVLMAEVEANCRRGIERILDLYTSVDKLYELAVITPREFGTVKRVLGSFETLIKDACREKGVKM